MSNHPYRIVDAQQRGWLGDGDGRYHAFDPSAEMDNRRPLHLDLRPVAEIVAEAGPVRPVEVPPLADQQRLQMAFARAERKLVGSLASALDQVYHEARTRFGPWDKPDPTTTAGYARRTLTAGRPGSWESASMMEVVYFGNGLNLWPRKAGASVEQMRESGPNPKRVDVGARNEMAAVLRGWVFGEKFYVEVAENLVEIVCQFADEVHEAEGWAKIADQWLQPGGLAVDDFKACYGLLYSVSRHFNVDLLS